jgi:hypothetical protein
VYTRVLGQNTTIYVEFDGPGGPPPKLGHTEETGPAPKKREQPAIVHHVLSTNNRPREIYRRFMRHRQVAINITTQLAVRVNGFQAQRTQFWETAAVKAVTSVICLTSSNREQTICLCRRIVRLVVPKRCETLAKFRVSLDGCAADCCVCAVSMPPLTHGSPIWV